MVQVELELITALIGAVVYVLYRCLTSWSQRPVGKKSLDDCKAMHEHTCHPEPECDSSSTTPTEEPGPEPQPHDIASKDVTFCEASTTLADVTIGAQMHKQVQKLHWTVVVLLVLMCLVFGPQELNRHANYIPSDFIGSGVSHDINTAAPPTDTPEINKDVKDNVTELAETPEISKDVKDNVTKPAKQPEINKDVKNTANEPAKTPESNNDVKDNASESALVAPTMQQKKPMISLPLKRQQILMHSFGSITYHRSSYWGEFKVGTPPELFKVVFDTGSGNLILPSMYCKDLTCREHKRFSAKKSTSCKEINVDGSEPDMTRDKVTITFGTGRVSGVIVDDIICMPDDAVIGAKLDSNVTVSDTSAADLEYDTLPKGCTRLRFIAAITMTEQPFKDFVFDGVLGLGLASLSEAPEFNFPNVMSQYLIAQGSDTPNMFSVFLADDDEGSELTFGGWPEERMEGELKWSDVYEPHLGHWLLQVKSLRVDNTTISRCENGACNAVVDTGTSLLAVPSRLFPELFELMKHDAPSDSSVDCTGSGPNLHFELDDITITLEPKDYARLATAKYYPDENRPFQTRLQKAIAASKKETYCKPMMMTMDLPPPVGPNLFILGEPVLRKYLTVYDAKNKRIGFSRARHTDEDENVKE